MKPYLTILCLSLTLVSCSKKKTEAPQTTTSTSTEAVDSQTNQEQSAEEALAPLIKEAEVNPAEAPIEFTDAAQYMNHVAELIGKAQTENDVDAITKLLGNKTLNGQQQELLQKLISDNALKLAKEDPLTFIGELKANKHARWAINLENNSPIVLDLKRDNAGKWKINKITLPKDSAAGNAAQLPDAATDALNHTHSFLRQLLKQDFQSAKKMVNQSNITDAKLAGLCIIFEEAQYHIDTKKPLRALFMRDTSAGFYANVISKDGEKAAQFSIITQRENADSEWQIYEINLDQLLGDYAKRVSGGDTYYTPLLKNPKGGDSLVIYFEFDSEGLTPRTQKQLNIVSNLLKLDKKNTIKISGHTDSKGGDDYNSGLSNKRAQAVKEYFANHGVSPEQVVIEAHGAKIPRQPNTKADGSDNPTGRRANRRTEIYLDF